MTIATSTPTLAELREQGLRVFIGVDDVVDIPLVAVGEDWEAVADQFLSVWDCSDKDELSQFVELWEMPVPVTDAEVEYCSDEFGSLDFENEYLPRRADTETLTLADIAQIVVRAWRDSQAHKPSSGHRHEAATTSEPLPFSGSVAPAGAQPNPMAYGSISFVETCSCGAERRVNANGGQSEVSAWFDPSEADEEAA